MLRRRSFATVSLAFAVFLGCLAVYNLNGIPISSSDNKPSLLLPHALLTRGSIDLSPYFAPAVKSEPVPYYYRARGELLSSDKVVFFSVVATPFYAAGWGLVRLAHGPLPELRFAHYTDDPPLAWFAVEKIAASLMAATTSALMFLVLWIYWRRRGVALAGTAAFALLTNHWATSSQGMWNHGGLALLIAGLMLAWARLERAAADGFSARAVTLTVIAGSLCAAWAMPVRTTGAGYAVAWLGYVAWRWRRHFWLAAAPVAAMAAVFFAFNLWISGSIAGYYGARAAPFWAYGWWENFKAWAGLLVSPGAGLFIFTPIALLSVIGAGAAWRRTDDDDRALRGWIWPVLFCYAAAATNTDAIPQLRWHAAASYGPRYFVDALPALALFGVHGSLALAAAARGWPRWRRALLGGAVGAAAVWSAGTQVVGVVFFKFNHALRPRPIHLSLERLWDWRDNPLSREVRTGVNLDVIAVWSVLTGHASRPVMLAAPHPIAAVTLAEAAENFFADERRMIDVEVRNISASAWPGALALGFAQLRVEGSWQRADGASFPAVPEPTTVPMVGGLAAGGARRWPVLIAAPLEPGDYRLSLGLRQGERSLSEAEPLAALHHVLAPRDK